jgi:hypothetical protein
MEIFYKVSMLHDNGKHWVVMDSGDEKEMQKTLVYWRNLSPLRTFRLEKHTMEVLDV